MGPDDELGEAVEKAHAPFERRVGAPLPSLPRRWRWSRCSDTSRPPRSCCCNRSRGPVGVSSEQVDPPLSVGGWPRTF